MNKVVVTGIGFASSIGTGSDQVLASLRDLRHGFVRKRLAGDDEGPELVCGSVDGFEVDSTEARDWVFPGSTELDPNFIKGLPPHGPFAFCALEEALDQAGFERELLNQGQTGLFCASNGSPRLLRHHLNRMADANWQRAHPMGVVSSVAGTLNFNFAAHYGITGANCGFVSACASSSHALSYAFDEITLGRQQAMLVVGAEDGTAESLLPFLGMRALSSNLDPDSASRPFDRQRDGFIGSGGGAAMILESASSAEARGAEPLARMDGWAQASDGYNIAAPHPEGRGIQAAMQRCLDQAGVDPLTIGWVSAHATSTPAGDRAEAIGLQALGFGDESSTTQISSTKGLTGHGLSFAGLLEAAIGVLALSEQIIPGNAALRDPDPVCAGLHLPTETRSADLRYVLNNSSGFGGANVCHLFAKAE